MSMSSTQQTYPRRAVARTIVAAVVSFAAMWPLLIEAAGFDPGAPFWAATIAVMGGVTRVMAIPAVIAWTSRFVPWLSPAPADQGE